VSVAQCRHFDLQEFFAGGEPLGHGNLADKAETFAGVQLEGGEY
jgi:hypothetical protein